MANKKPAVQYAERENLDGELNAAIESILSAEAEARRIIAQAEMSVKAIQLDAATRERDLKASAVGEAAVAKDKAVADAVERAEAECEKMRADAEKRGNMIVDGNRKNIDKIAAELIKSL